ncbi:HU family DNA-binding protein [Aquicoccus sp. G2-2]|uniref:HU family DNA-binding protein n=1 Tax=Aquicoccus sp. G2-2 TaxID=3092120 RepID=UPI002AE02AFA|nr:HU family DNA-binding protein [Aquicoccus sp. G2-2]MEA1112955.1 HU family DNA-binding protein [Aquicoccus sp. G2-2]
MTPKKATSARKSARQKVVSKPAKAKPASTSGATKTMEDVKSQAAAISGARKTLKLGAQTETAGQTKPTADVAPVDAAPAKVVAAEVDTSPPALRKKELLTAVVARSGVKRRDAKATLEAALEIMGETIADGRDMNLPGFGKAKVARSKKLTRGSVYVTRIRQPELNADDTPNDPLAEAAE